LHPDFAIAGVTAGAQSAGTNVKKTIAERFNRSTIQPHIQASSGRWVGVSVKGTAMSDLVVIVYPNEEKAEEVRKRLFELQVEHLIKIGDAVIATKTESGSVKLNQMMNLTATGAAAGSVWGLLIGLVFLNPLIGVAAGAASGALSGALTDVGINDAFMKKFAETIEPGSAALFVLVKEITTDNLLAAINGYGGVVLKTSFDETKEQALREALKSAAAS
jgi:uncharacterized membrane protein